MDLKNLPVLDESFPHDYDCSVAVEIPNRSDIRYFPDGISSRGKDGLIVNVTPYSISPWAGMFAFGEDLKGLNGLFTCPLSGQLLVVSRGQGYFVLTDQPDCYHLEDAYPIRNVISLPSLGLLILANLTEFVAYRSEGLAWVSDRVSWDGFKVRAVDASRIIGTTWDPGLEKEVEFILDAETGKCKGSPLPKV